MNLETLKRGNDIQENIVFLTKSLALLTESMNRITEEDFLITEVRSSAWKEKIAVGNLLPGMEILTLYKDRIKAEIDRLQMEFDAL